MYKGKGSLAASVKPAALVSDTAKVWETAGGFILVSKNFSKKKSNIVPKSVDFRTLRVYNIVIRLRNGLTKGLKKAPRKLKKRVDKRSTA